ncbi:hypothetical protein GGH12_000606 [Coemansia sp. RSA 1822]|nr:hypothetical protein LPJ76_001313 [Coemansia sp. RSA 638]KAJ2125525.1 hypothetical protein IW147_000877 [Coemansia sp. RSA 720]KAJ2544342.1 hypothetical protein GGF49_001323 [Coemansia sp. RSA 1853]KAJ2566830.1 hypothetical protein GGH12_000606 [Coemansia sp. RSA 1822]
MMFGSINSSGAIIDVTKHGEASDILLPNQIERVQKVAVDIGGSLAKVVYLTSGPRSQGGRLHFAAFETDNVEKCVAFIRTLLDTDNTEEPVIMATGGGAHRFRDLLNKELGVEIRVEDEMESLTAGLNFLIREVADEVFTYSEDRPMQFVDAAADMFPYMLVNIGSGVSILKVTGEDEFERISGTSLGGGTLWGLLNLLTGVRSFDAMLEMTKTGDNAKVDMMVGDIYGTNYGRIGLKASNIASSMGGVYRKTLDKHFDDSDIARSLLYMVSNNIGQIAYLNAQLHGIRHIYFGGYFIRGHPLTMHTLSYAINFWSKGEMRALFLRHEGFLGATGAFFIGERMKTVTPALELAPDVTADAKDAEPLKRRARAYSFTENFSIAGAIADDAIGSLGMLDREPSKLEPLPQLVNTAAHPYTPDTVDLTHEPRQQEYWISAMERNTNGLLDLADSGALPGCEDPESRQRLSRFVSLYLKHLHRLRDRPLAYGAMSVRALLGLREQCLHEVGLEDIFAGVKQHETQAALDALPMLLRETDAMDKDKKPHVLLQNVLAGNMFDWGATALRGALAEGSLDLDKARDQITWRPEFDNGTDFVKRIRTHQYKHAVVFVDNSGADVCLGVLPFVRFLLQRGTRVVLAANSRPALNDVTERELIDIVRRAGLIDSAFQTNLLSVCGTGSSGPCLDMRKLDARLVQATRTVDLVVIVGMGRAIHSNYFARFTCDSLKLAVFKNQMAADAAHAQIYDALCKYEQR